jgi:hypothetical protein
MAIPSNQPAIDCLHVAVCRQKGLAHALARQKPQKLGQFLANQGFALKLKDKGEIRIVLSYELYGIKIL